MVMTHYMELLSMHQPWNLIIFMLVPMVLAETILAAGIFSLFYKDSRSACWGKVGHYATIILGIFFIVVTVYLGISYVPTIQWRGPIDYIAVFSYLLGVIPAILLLLQELGVTGSSMNDSQKTMRHVLLMILFVVFTHFAMVFGMADPQLAGYTAPQQSMQMNHQMMNHNMTNGNSMNHDMMNQDKGMK